MNCHPIRVSTRAVPFRWLRRLRGVAPGLLLAPLLVMALGFAGAAHAEKRIVLIGGPKSHGPAEHDYPNAIRMFAAWLKASPDVQGAGAAVESYPEGWPADPRALDRASTIVLYLDAIDDDGVWIHPLLDEARATAFRAQIRRGAGLVMVHQAFTVPPDRRLDWLADALGAIREGQADRTDETVRFSPPAHPVTRGLSAFDVTGEFYPTIRFTADPRRLTPLLSGAMHIQVRNNRPAPPGAAVTRTAAWAFERSDSGRSFGFSGGHFVDEWQDPNLRRLLVNAVLWSARIEVPAKGATADPNGAITRQAVREAHGRSEP